MNTFTLKKRKRKAGQKAGLTRAAIVAKSLALQAQNSKLTMVRIAKSLGVAPAAVYAHFPGGLSEILTEMVRGVLSDVARPFKPNETWEDYLRGLFAAVFNAFHKHRNIAVFFGGEIATDYCLNPQLVERILFALSLAGLPDSAKASALDLVIGSLVSMLTIEHVGPASTPPAQWLHGQSHSIDALPANEYPEIKAIKTQFLEAAKERSEQPAPANALRFADHLIAGLKAQIPPA